MNFRNLIGIYQFAIARCIDVIGFDNDITRNADGTHEEVWDIISAVENLMLDNGNVDVIEEMDFSEEKLETARRFQNLLYEMKNLDKRIADIEKENQTGSMAEKVLESVSSGKATVNEARASSGLEPMRNRSIMNRYIKACNFELKIFGSVLNPQIIIGGYEYLINDYLENGEYIIVDSLKRTVTKIMNDGTAVNIFDSREKKRSVFQKIRSGRSLISWSGKFDFMLTLYEERAEPQWH